jgi:hypothetical protein
MTAEQSPSLPDPATEQAFAFEGAALTVSEQPPGEDHLIALMALAEGLEGDPGALLDLLRRLEKLHRAIQDGAFRNSLPEDRNRLYRLLEAMEDSGGWPYIPRLQLRTFMDLLQREAPRPTLPEGDEPLAA